MHGRRDPGLRRQRFVFDQEGRILASVNIVGDHGDIEPVAERAAQCQRQSRLAGTDRAILKTIIEKFGGGPVGLGTIAAATSEEEATIEEVVEPYLLQLGLLERTTRGRLATPKAYEHLGFELPADRQEKLL